MCFHSPKSLRRERVRERLSLSLSILTQRTQSPHPLLPEFTRRDSRTSQTPRRRFWETLARGRAGARAKQGEDAPFSRSFEHTLIELEEDDDSESEEEADAAKTSGLARVPEPPSLLDIYVYIYMYRELSSFFFPKYPSVTSPHSQVTGMDDGCAFVATLDAVSCAARQRESRDEDEDEDESDGALRRRTAHAISIVADPEAFEWRAPMTQDTDDRYQLVLE